MKTNSKAAALVSLSRFHEAIQCCNKALSIDNSDRTVLYWKRVAATSLKESTALVSGMD
jgi:hypothetical protein